MIDRTIVKSFAVEPAGRLGVALASGEIRVEIGAVNEVKISARERVSGDSPDAAEAALAGLNLTMVQTSTGVTISTVRPGSGWGFSGGGDPSPRVDVMVTVPPGYSARLSTAAGAIWVGDLRGDLEADTAGGSEHLGHIGGRVRARTSGGGIALAGGARAVSLATAGGSISVSGTGGPTTLHSSGGSITVTGAAGALHADARGGSVRAELVGPLRGDCVLESAGGGVRVTVPREVGFHLDAQARGGSVRADGVGVGVEYADSQRGQLVGTVGSGGPTVRLRASGGEIELALGPPSASSEPTPSAILPTSI